MKLFVFILLSFGLANLAASARNKEPLKLSYEKENDKSGISFYQGNWSEVLKLAKKENKSIFLDISTSWCPPCKMMITNTFPDKNVGQFYNTNFINVTVDAEKGEGITLAGKYNVTVYPTLLYLNSEGEVVGQLEGYRTPEQFLEIGEKVKNLMNNKIY